MQGALGKSLSGMSNVAVPQVCRLLTASRGKLATVTARPVVTHNGAPAMSGMLNVALGWSRVITKSDVLFDSDDDVGGSVGMPLTVASCPATRSPIERGMAQPLRVELCFNTESTKIIPAWAPVIAVDDVLPAWRGELTRREMMSFCHGTRCLRELVLSCDGHAVLRYSGDHDISTLFPITYVQTLLRPAIHGCCYRLRSTTVATTSRVNLFLHHSNSPQSERTSPA